MALENLTGPNVFITNLVASNPTATDPLEQGDDHDRGIKNVLLNSFPNITAAMTRTAAQLNAILPSDANPLAIGNAAPGISNAYSRSDHVHGPQAANYYSGQVLKAQVSNDVGGGSTTTTPWPVSGTVNYAPRAAGSLLMIDCSFDASQAYAAANNVQGIFSIFQGGNQISPSSVVMVAGNTGGYSHTGRVNKRFRIAIPSLAVMGFHLAAAVGNNGTQITVTNIEWLFLEIAG